MLDIHTKVSCATFLLISSIVSGCSAEPPKDVIAMQGMWKVIYYEEGTKEKKRDFDEFVVAVDNRMFIYRVEEKIQYEYDTFTLRLDPAHTPKRLDIVFEQDGEQVVRTNIYKIEGDTLTICFDPFHENYPEEFKTKKHDGSIVMKMRRIGSYEEEKALIESEKKKDHKPKKEPTQ